MPGPDRLPHLSEAWLTAVDEAVVAHEGLRRVSADLELVIEYRVAGVPDRRWHLAIDRGDDQVASLYDPLHPAVLRVMQFATEAALRARIPVNICGEIAGDPRYSALLLGLGIRELSMSSIGLPLVKQRIRSLSLDEATRRVRTMMEQSDSGVIAALLDDFNAVA